MNTTRQGEIALLILKQKMLKDGIRLSGDIRREAGNLSKEIGIPVDELMKFYEIVVREMVEKTFDPLRTNAMLDELDRKSR